MERNLKILIVNEFYYPVQKGGAEVSVRLLAEKFAALGYQVSLICTGLCDEEDLFNGVRIYRIKGNPIGWNGNAYLKNRFRKVLWHLADMYNWGVKKRIADIIKKERPDVIHTNNIAHISCSVWDVAKKYSIPVVHTLRDYNLMCPKRTLWNHHRSCSKQCVSCRFFSVPNKRVSQCVDAVVGISEHILQRHLNAGYFLNAKRMVIYNSINNVSPNRPCDAANVIGYLGKVHESKGVENLIDAFLSCESTKYKLLIAGDGDSTYVNMLKSKCEKSNNVFFVGRVNSAEFLNKIDLLVVPSIWEEPFGRTVVEPIAAGVPVIAAASGGIPEILKGCKLGLLYNPLDVGELAAKLKGFMNGTLAFDFSEKEKFMARFSSEAIAEQYLNLFKLLCKSTNDDKENV